MNKWQIVTPKDFEVDSKCYRFDGKQYVRVTQSLNIIAKPGIASWAARVGRKKVEAVIARRCDLGTTVHNLIERTLKGESFNLGNYEKEIQTDMNLFDEFRINTCLEPEALEQRVWSNKYGYAGTIDYVGEYKSYAKYMVRGHKTKFAKGAQVLGDWKTAADIYKSYWLQLAAYIVAFEELTGIKLAGGVIAQFRNSKIRVKEMTYNELIKQFEAYKNALGLYKWEHKLGKWAKK